MIVTVKIKDDSGTFVDRTEVIQKNSIARTDILNDKADRLSFTVPTYGKKGVPEAQNYYPEAGQETILTRDGTREFGGVITKTTTETERNNKGSVKVECKDYTHLLDRELILERYDDKTVNEIIADLQKTYAKSFTTQNVDCDIDVATITFNRIPFSKALKKLANLTNYSWYIDANKGIHFFAKNQNQAPFDVTKNNGKYLPRTLGINKDITQIRNRVTVKGGEETGQVRDETFDGGDSTEIDIGGQAFNLASKFAELPEVTVNGTDQTVGVENLDDGDTFDCFWSFQEKYVRFPDRTAPTDGDTVVITGNPLYPVIVEVSNADSIKEHGLYEFYKEDKTIASQDQALQRAEAELEAYAQEITEGEFDTYEPGLRSGQVVHVNVDGVNEDFLIKRVRFQMVHDDRGRWSVTLQTTKTFDIVSVLQDLLDDEVQDTSEESLLTLRKLEDTVTVEDSTPTASTKSGPYYVAPDDPANEDPNKEYGVVNFSTVSS